MCEQVIGLGLTTWAHEHMFFQHDQCRFLIPLSAVEAMPEMVMIDAISASEIYLDLECAAKGQKPAESVQRALERLGRALDQANIARDAQHTLVQDAPLPEPPRVEE